MERPKAKYFLYDPIHVLCVFKGKYPDHLVYMYTSSNPPDPNKDENILCVMGNKVYRRAVKRTLFFPSDYVSDSCVRGDDVFMNES